MLFFGPHALDKQASSAVIFIADTPYCALEDSMRVLKPTLKLILALGLGLLFLLPLTLWAANLVTNPGLEDPYEKIGEYIGPGGIVWDQQVAHDWHKFTIEAPNRLRFFTASDWAAFNNSSVVERRDGEEAQVWWTPEKNDAGIYQQVSGLTLGETYGFQAGILQVFETTNRTDPATGNMNRSVGIDPYGGTDPQAETVIWGPEEKNATYNDPATGKKFTWFYPGVGATAMSTTVTIFARVRIAAEAGPLQSNQVWVDDTFMDLAPPTALSLSVTSPTEITAAWGGEPRAGFNLFAYEAQYRKATDPDWTDLQIFTVSTPPSTATGQSFTVEPGLEYLVRARTWHEQEGGDKHEVPGPWVQQSIVAGGIVSGEVVDNQGNGLSGVTVSVTNAATSTTSGAGGGFGLLTGPGTFGITATTSSGWHTLEPISVTLTMTETASLTLTLSPPDNFIQNGGLEGNLDGWHQTLLQPPAQATFVDQGQRSGAYSLRIFGNGSLTQTGVVSDMYRPILSFWHKIEGGAGDDSLVVRIFGRTGSEAPGQPGSLLLPATEPLTITQATTGWQHISLPLVLSGTEVYSGLLSVEFVVNQTSLSSTLFYLDEISFGGAWGGPIKVYLPLISKNS
jgi:hypothetical protein